jgi:hypothetical protein
MSNLCSPGWKSFLRRDPLPTLLGSTNPAISWFTRRDLLGQDPGLIESLWELKEPVRILRKQGDDGRWRYPAGDHRIRSREDYDQLETFRSLLHLVHKYGVDRRLEAVSRAAEFLFSFQTDEGDFRGIYVDQYTPNYSAIIIEVLINAGYTDDTRIYRGLDWLLSMRQDNGGWAIPFRTTGRRLSVAFSEGGLGTIKGDRSKPSSHLITGTVLRGFAAHPRYRHRDEIMRAGELLKSSFFKRDRYPDRASTSYWENINYPFWWNDILSAMDSLSLIGFDKSDKDIRSGLEWLIDDQGDDGLWRSRYAKGKDPDIHQWVSLAACRVIKRLLE